MTDQCTDCALTIRPALRGAHEWLIQSSTDSGPPVRLDSDLKAEEPAARSSIFHRTRRSATLIPTTCQSQRPRAGPVDRSLRRRSVKARTPPTRRVAVQGETGFARPRHPGRQSRVVAQKGRCSPRSTSPATIDSRHSIQREDYETCRSCVVHQGTQGAGRGPPVRRPASSVFRYLISAGRREPITAAADNGRCGDDLDRSWQRQTSTGPPR
jgi:hypothetical protein